MPEITSLLTRSPALLWRVLALALCAYLGICILLFLLQQRLIYLPTRGQAVLPAGFEDWVVTNDTGRAEFTGYKRVVGSAHTLFFFHGNGGNASGWSHAVDSFPGDIFVLEYPGYGSRNGSPSETSLKAAALRAFEAEATRYSNVVLCGQSLGAAVTEAVFKKHADRIDALVLVTPFVSLASVAGAHYPWVPARWLLRDKYNIYEAYADFPGKSLVMIAKDDEIIPRVQSMRYLSATNASRCVLELPDTSHNTVHLDEDFWRKVLAHDFWR